MPSDFVWSTRANALTLLRLLAIVPLCLSILGGSPLLASAIFALAVATDVADGWVARRYGEATPLGGLIDHAVDATFVSTGLGALALQGVMPGPLPPLVALAFVQYAVDSRLAGSVGLRASGLGRWNGIAYYVALAVPLVRDALDLGWPEPALVRGLGWLLVVSTAVSMLDRLRALLRGLDRE